MKAKTSMFLNRTAAVFLIVMMLFAGVPASPAGAISQNITSAQSGTWEATAWPDTTRSGTITVTSGSSIVTGTGTAFTTELSVGNILKTGGIQIGTVASIDSDTQLTLSNVPMTGRLDVTYTSQGVGPADNVTIDNGHIVTINARPANQTGTVTVNAGGTLTVSNAATTFTTLTVNGTVNADATAAFGALVVNNGGILNAAGTAATLNYTASSLTINTGGTVNLFRNFTVNGATTISGTITFSSTTTTSRAMVFAGPVTLNAGAIWTEPATGNPGSNNTYAFQDNFTNNAATFTTSDLAGHAFSGAGKTLSGTTSTSIGEMEVSGTYTNSGNLTVRESLFGTGALTNGAAGSLTLGDGAVTSITTLANAGTLTKEGAGPINTAVANFTNTGTINLNGTGTISGITNNAGGVVNLNSSGTIATFINATATSTLNISDLTPPTITNFNLSAAGNTVNYNGAGDQTVRSTTYSNLVFSGSGNKAIAMGAGSTLATGNLSITGTAKASVTGAGLVVNTLSLGGASKPAGTWGSSLSTATNKDDTYFAGTGHLSVTTQPLQSQTITFTSTAPTNAVVGGTYTPTATATSGLPVTFTIDASASSVCSISAGVVTFNAAGTCVVNANQAGNGTYQPAAQVQQSFTVTQPGQTPTFSDVPSTYWAYAFIERLYDAGITGGCATTPSLQYCPEAPVTRDQMAVFLLRGIHNASYAPPAPGTTTGFGDVPTSHWAAAWIKQLAAEGITSGCGNGNYCPAQPVTRAQMAVFLLRAKHGTGYAPPAATGVFGDVPGTYWAAAWIEQLAAEGITSGCGNGNYCPENPVTRAEMAVFLVRTFNLP